MYAGRSQENEIEDEIIYVAINTYWERDTFTMPNIAYEYKWKVVIDTMDENGYIEDKNVILDGSNCIIGPRSVMVFRNVDKHLE